MEIKNIPINEIKPYFRNTKKHPQSQIDKIAKQIKEHGFDVPLVVDADYTLIKGHGRLLALKQLGHENAPVIVRTDLSPAQVKAARIADNKIAESEWDMDFLKEELKWLDDLDFDFELTGFDESILNQIDGFDNPTKAEDEWVGMPEYEQEQLCHKKVTVNFESEEDFNRFFKVLGQSHTEKTKSIWYPEKERNDLKDMRFE